MAIMAKKKGRKPKGRRSKPYSTLEQHQRQGSQLVPPLATLSNLRHASWIAERLPELLWCALVVVHVGRERGLELFRRAVIAAKPRLDGIKGPFDLGLTGLAALPEPARSELLDALTRDADAQDALRPLLLFPALPGRENWEPRLDKPSADDWHALAVAVAKVLDHQSQEATDCRWARVVFRAVTGYIVLPKGATELGRELLEYPNYGDQRKVRPTVRAMEIAFSRDPGDVPLEWPPAFWRHAWRSTPCDPVELHAAPSPPAPGATTDTVSRVATLLTSHYTATETSTCTDAKHDAVFGLAAYSVSVLAELLRLGLPTSLVARTGVRAILEAHITLAYLLKRNEPTLWLQFRSYGAGQAKLAFLKLDAAAANKAGFVDNRTLEMIATEDQSLEFLPVVLGHWDETNLRKMADEANVKDLYDGFYAWTSAFVHGNWAALRAASFDFCLNPLHRLHRVLRPSPTPQADVVGDAARMVDKTLELLSAAYPTFAGRVSAADST
jgi:hypothetical protein